jgi:hypothetical protein
LELKAYQWKNRLLLLFAPAASSDEYIAQWDTLNRHWDGVLERDLRVVSIFEEEVGDVDGDDIDPAAGDDLRRQYRIKRNQSVVILIGKDGTEKKRVPMPADVTRLFALIDTMPMRQDEMRQRNND